MKKKYKQLDKEQRYQIGILLEAGKNKSEIANLISVHKATLTRELQRNICKPGLHAGNYVPHLAQGKTDARHKQKNKSIKFTDELKDQAANWLRFGYISPIEKLKSTWPVALIT